MCQMLLRRKQYFFGVSCMQDEFKMDSIKYEKTKEVIK
jgi:hypothetical protein